LNILLAGNVPSLLEILSSSLIQEGHEISIAKDGEAAYLLLQEEFFDLSILEYDLPSMRAPEILTRLKEEKKKLPATMVICSSSTEGIIQECTDAGASDILVKPSGPMVILYRFRKLLISSLDVGGNSPS
jgi:two-component system phosphate regulon response regulator PhoB